MLELQNEKAQAFAPTLLMRRQPEESGSGVSPVSVEAQSGTGVPPVSDETEKDGRDARPTLSKAEELSLTLGDGSFSS